MKMQLGCMGASSLGVVHCTVVVDVYMAEIFGWPIWNGIEVQKTREKVQMREDELSGTNGEWMCLDQGCNMNKMTLACPPGMVKFHEASFY